MGFIDEVTPEDLAADMEADEAFENDMPPDDIYAYEQAIEECRKIFLERREQYGNHLNRDPAYERMSMGVKGYRLFTDVRDGNPMKRDTMIDLTCYLLMHLSRKHVGEHGS